MLDQSAMISFYFFVSIFPLLLFLMTLLGLLLHSDQEFEGILRHYLGAVVPRLAATRFIDTTLGEFNRVSGALKLPASLLFSPATLELAGHMSGQLRNLVDSPHVKSAEFSIQWLN
ncbi:MAG: YhjD/YihY/BrkB family envelope integrity protein [Pseudomonadota bacterium]